MDLHAIFLEHGTFWWLFFPFTEIDVKHGLPELRHNAPEDDRNKQTFESTVD
jgi:hypothetical protein